jgi:Zn-finger nucleic acid-binding protein
MKCPICDIEMRISEREGVEIDYCPQCRGVWLDRGELEKLIARVESQPVRGRDDDDDDDREYRDRRGDSQKRDEYRRDDEYRREAAYPQGRKKKEGFLSNLFDVFGD